MRPELSETKTKHHKQVYYIYSDMMPLLFVAVSAF